MSFYKPKRKSGINKSQAVWSFKKKTLPPPPWKNHVNFSYQIVMKKKLISTSNKKRLAFQTGASIYQTMSVALGCFIQLHEVMELGVLRAAVAMDDVLPAHSHPLGGSVILQVITLQNFIFLLRHFFGKNLQKNNPFFNWLWTKFLKIAFLRAWLGPFLPIK